MRKVWLSLFLIVILTVTAAIPAAASVADPTQFNENGLLDGLYQQVRNIFGVATQPTDPSIPEQTKPPVPSEKEHSGTTAPAQDLTADENYIFQQVNSERAQAGLAPLEIDYRLVRTARAKSQDMIDNGYFDHQSPVLGSPFDQMQNAGISYRFAGENIAGNNSVSQAMQAWINSPGHRANILNPDFTRIGIGVVDGGPDGKMLTQHFIGV
jgi:uncharacterized YkwD family protein